MAEPHVVSALVRKHAEVAGEIEAAEKRVAQLRADLLHLDAVLCLFDPGAKPGAIPPKRPAVRRNEWFAPGELARRVLDTLRTAAGEPLTTREITRRVMTAHGLDAGDGRTLERLDKCVGGYLRRRRDGLIEAVIDQDGGAVRWRIGTGIAASAATLAG